MNIEIIKSIINCWDPIGLFATNVPEDEYDVEINEIKRILHSTKDEFELGYKIYNIFTDSFGNDIFNKDLSECVYVAKKVFKLKTKK